MILSADSSFSLTQFDIISKISAKKNLSILLPTACLCQIISCLMIQSRSNGKNIVAQQVFYNFLSIHTSKQCKINVRYDMKNSVSFAMLRHWLTFSLVVIQKSFSLLGAKTRVMYCNDVYSLSSCMTFAREVQMVADS